MERLKEICLEAYDRLIGLELSEVAVDGCVTKAPCGGEKAGISPVDRGKRAIKRSMAVDAKGIPLGAVSAPANRHDSPLLVPTLKAASEVLGALPEETSVHLDRGYDSKLTRERLEELGLGWEISGKGKPAPFWASRRWVVERTSSWHNAHKKLVWCTERVGRVDRFLGGLLGGGHHRKEADPGSMEPLPLGDSTASQTMTYSRRLLVWILGSPFARSCLKVGSPRARALVAPACY